MKRSAHLSCVVVPLLALGILQAPQQEPPKAKPKPGEPAQESKDARKPRRERVVTDLSGFDLLAPEKKRMVVGATRGLPRPVALAPRMGKLYGSGPTFVWSYAGRERNFVFILRDDAQQEVYRAEVTGTSYQYPASAPALEPGKTYLWTIELASTTILSSPSAPAGFLVVAPAQREEIKRALGQIQDPDPYQAGLARARLFTDHRLWYDALATYAELIARYPDRGELYEERGMIYAQLDDTRPLADQDFAKADDLKTAKATK
jgi:hypothetical protein